MADKNAAAVVKPATRAYATLLADGDGADDSFKGVVRLAKGLHNAGSAYPLVVAVLPDVPASRRRVLVDELGCVVREVQPVYPLYFSKLRVWEARAVCGVRSDDVPGRGLPGVVGEHAREVRAERWLAAGALRRRRLVRVQTQHGHRQAPPPCAGRHDDYEAAHHHRRSRHDEPAHQHHHRRSSHEDPPRATTIADHQQAASSRQQFSNGATTAKQMMMAFFMAAVAVVSIYLHYY